MPKPRWIPLARPRLSEAAVAAAASTLRSGHLAAGERVARFEAAFAAACGATHAVATASGTMALWLAYAALFAPGDEVLVPSFTHVSTVAMIRLAGAVPVLCDIDRRTWNLDPADVERRRTARTRGLVGVHLFGNPCDADALGAAAERCGLRVVWDACQAHGTLYRGHDVGAMGDAACYSFYPTKAMTTGEGGMVTTPDAALAERLRRLRDHGQHGKYRHVLWGINGRMTDVEAAVGLVELRELAVRVEGRRRHAAVLARAVEAVPGLDLQAAPDGGVSSFHQFAVRIGPRRLRRTRAQAVAHFASRGIETAIHYPRPVHCQPAWAAGGGPAASLRASESLARHVLSLPVRHDLTSGEVERIAAAVEALGGGGER